MVYIIKSKKKGEEYWSGKEFSSSGAKIYSSADDAMQALSNYWYCSEAKQYNDQVDGRQITIVPMDDDSKQFREMLAINKIRW